MSAGLDHPSAESLVCSDLDKLAPKMRLAVRAALNECHDAGLDAAVYETTRSDELQELYWERGRSVIPPSYTVTNVRSAQYGWHFYGLAVDVISNLMRWDVSDDWRRKVTAIFKKHGLAAGAEWPHPDFPHYQWGRCHRSPTDEARALYKQGGLRAVWSAVGAL